MSMFQIAIVLPRMYLSIVNSIRENCWTVNKIKIKIFVARNFDFMDPIYKTGCRWWCADIEFCFVFIRSNSVI